MSRSGSNPHELPPAYWGGDPRRGAAMGRPSRGPLPDSESPRLYLARVRLDSGGYDRGGAYWGHGAPLYHATDGATFETFVRARTRDAAKSQVRDLVPGARFYT